MNIMVIGAHLDDPEIIAGGMALHWKRNGHRVIFAALSDGSMGHHKMSPEETVARRKKEAAASAAILHVEYEFLDFPECMFDADCKHRIPVVELIRRYAPEMIVTHPPFDYHVDHKNCSTLIADALFMLQVPKYAPGSQPMRHTPIVFYSVIRESYMDSLIPARVEATDDVFEQRLRALHCHESQMYEWLPWVNGMTEAIPTDEAGRLEFLRRWRGGFYRRIADRYRSLLSGKDRNAQNAEVLFRSSLGSEAGEEFFRKLDGGFQS